MRASKSFSIAMIVFTIIWVISIVLLNCIDDVSVWVNIILWICEVFLVICCVQSIRQKIVFKNNELIYTPIFCKSRKTHINDIDKVVACSYSNGLIKYKIYVGAKVFCVFANSAVGATLLLEALNKANIPILDKA